MVDTLSSLVTGQAPAQDVAHYLEALSAPERRLELMSVPVKLLAKLYALVKEQSRLSVEAFVPPVDKPVVYALRNSIAVLPNSAKCVYRGSEGPAWGYNRTSRIESLFAGPGYFVIEEGQSGALVFDYTKLPSVVPDGFPVVVPNKGLFRGLVYGEMTDDVWRVCEDTAIGLAYQHGKSRDVYFLITRASLD